MQFLGAPSTSRSKEQIFSSATHSHIISINVPPFNRKSFKIIVLYIVIYTLLDHRQEDKEVVT